MELKKVNHQYKKLSKDQKAIIIIGISIPIITFIVFWLIPKFKFLFLAFETLDKKTGKYVFSLINFKNFFISLKNPYSAISESIKNTLIAFFFDTFVKTPICYVFAFFLYKKVKGSNFFRWVFFLPSILSGVVVSGFVLSFMGVLGPFPKLVEALTNEKILFFQDEAYTMKTLICVHLWSGFGVALLYYVSAMVRIPNEIIESAKVDGFSLFQEFIYINIPLVWPTITTLLLLSVTAIWGADVGSLLYTNGEYGTSTLNYWIYSNTVEGDYNYVSAVGLFFTVLTIPLVILVNYLTSKIETTKF